MSWIAIRKTLLITRVSIVFCRLWFQFLKVSNWWDSVQAPDFFFKTFFYHYIMILVFWLDSFRRKLFFPKYSKQQIRKYWLCIAEVFYYVNYVSVNFSVKNSTIDCKYLLFLQDFFIRLKPKQYKKCQYSWLFKTTIWKLIENKVNIYNQQLNFCLNNWHLHNWRSRKPQLLPF